jgi:methionyl-tRNA formyltransferase
MKVTIFTSNSLRHLSLINKISSISKECNAIVEVKTLFPGLNKDFFKKSKKMRKYFIKVDKAEKKYFKKNSHIKNHVNLKMIKQGDLNNLNKEDLKFALNSDVYIIFGASYIKNKWLINFLIKNKAINIHMGLSPFYRGSSCNFWALCDKNPEYVGATIHYLSKGLDSGKIISHCLPNHKEKNFFKYTMSAVKTSQSCLKNLIKSKKLFKLEPKKQDRNLQMSYTRNNEFDAKSLNKFLKIKKIDIQNSFKKNDHLKKLLVNPYYFNKKEE